MSLPHTANGRPPTDHDEPLEYVVLPPHTDPDHALQILKHIIDYYMNQHREAILPRYLYPRLPSGVSLETWRAAARYANDRTKALNEEIKQLRSRITEIISKTCNSELEIQNFKGDKSLRIRYYLSDLFVDNASIQQLKDAVVDLIRDRRKKVDEMEQSNRLIARYGAVEEGVVTVDLWHLEKRNEAGFTEREMEAVDAFNGGYFLPGKPPR